MQYIYIYIIFIYNIYIYIYIYNIHIQLSIGPMFFLRNEFLVRDRPPIPTHLEIETFNTHMPDPILMTIYLTKKTTKQNIDILGGYTF